MSNLMIRNQRPEMSMIKQTLQYAFFLIVCVWFLYQIHYLVYVRRDSGCDFIQSRLIDERIAKVLGRKGGVGKSHFTEEVELYGVDLIGEAVGIGNVTAVGGGQSSDDGGVVVEWDDQGKQSDRVELVRVEEKKGNASQIESEMKSVVKVNAVILKKGEKFGVVKFSDQKGVLQHDSGPSKRSDVEVKSERKRCIPKAENQTGEMEGCQNVSEQNATEQLRVRNSEKGAVEEVMPGILTVESAKGSMRDLLLSDM